MVIPIRLKTCCPLLLLLQRTQLPATTTIRQNSNLSFRQEQKAEAKKKKPLKSRSGSEPSPWDLTVGIEIHAQLNTPVKLFSASPSTSASDDATPNSRVALHDLGYPGAQPVFQAADTLIPALRAALALNCKTIRHKSSFDRKHYMYADQPAGYQITQFYEPFAENGHVVLSRQAGDSIAAAEGYDEVRVGIKQIQLEQDTGKSLAHSAHSTLVDYNRSSSALIEIVSMPDIRHAATAAAFVRKVQLALKRVGAVSAGMEAGGLRADVNVSIRRPGETTEGRPKLGQRTEIKNLNSFRAIESAVNAEMQRQIGILESGAVVTGETRGWKSGGTTTHRLRDKEHEVDYRYMPDADLGPVIIPASLIDSVRDSLLSLPDDVTRQLVIDYGLSEIDARTLFNLGDGERLEYFYEVVHTCLDSVPNTTKAHLGRMTGNLILHDLGSILTTTVAADWSPELIPTAKMADIVSLLARQQISSANTKQLIVAVITHESRGSTPSLIANQLGLLKQEVSDDQIEQIVNKALSEAPAPLIEAAQSCIKTFQPNSGKVQALVGLCMRQFKAGGLVGGVQPQRVKDMIICRLSSSK